MPPYKGRRGKDRKEPCRRVNSAAGCMDNNCQQSHDLKGEECRAFAKGNCNFRDDCKFLHSKTSRSKENVRPGNDKKEPCRRVNSVAGCHIEDCPLSHDLKGEECRAFAKGNCNFRDDCKFVHTEQGNRPREQIQDGRARHRSRRDSPQAERLTQWREEHYSADTVLAEPQLAQFFREALDLLQTDAGTMQQVISVLSGGGGLKRVMQVLEGDFGTPEKQDNSPPVVLLLFKVIGNRQVVNCRLLQDSLATIYDAVFGEEGTRTSEIFEFLVSIVDTMSSVDLEHSLIVFHKVLDLKGKTVPAEHFERIAKTFSEGVDGELSKDGMGDLHMINSKQWLARIKARLIIFLNEVLPKFGSDGPGLLGEGGPRHNNDFADIGKIQIMPTFQEITASRPAYLPVLDSAQLHLPRMEGLIDRHFRLYREDVVGPIRDAVRSELDPEKPVDGRQKSYRYTNLSFHKLRCNIWSGLVLTVAIDQPPEVERMSPTDRQDWWLTRKRLQRDSLVCILDKTGGRAIFCTVTEVRLRERKSRWNDHKLDNDEEDQEDEETKLSYEDFSSNPRRALLTLSLTQDDDALSVLDYYNRPGNPQGLTLIEFPKTLVQAFRPTLVALQSMIVDGETPFSDLLAPSLEAAGSTATIDPPAYAQQNGFKFDLSCLLSEGKSLSLSPIEDFKTEALTESSTLDDKQAETLVDSLRHRLAICQGPPGTGKSFTALALIRTLLANKQGADLGPILIVTYTNHALDQSIESCLDSGITKIVRLGAGSKSERLQDLNVRALTKDMNRTDLERETQQLGFSKCDRRCEQANKAIEQILLSKGKDDLKGFLSKSYPVQYAQFLEKSKAGSGTSSLIRAWINGQLGSLDGPQEERTVTELLDTKADIGMMLPRERQALNKFWKTQRNDARVQGFLSALKEYKRHKANFDAAQREVDVRCMQNADIIGVTTSGLAKHYDILKRLPIKVLLVEEAGEILESHTLTAMLPSVEHAILIGDHFQLKPSVNNYGLTSESDSGKRYSLDMSLFERLVNPPQDIPGVKVPFSTLEIQRRMHPSISSLVRQMYPRLKDSSNVETYPQVVGMQKRLYWFDHRNPEAGAETDEMVATSKSNDFEVEMTASLVAHLLSQGEYQSHDLAVLTPYLGQLHKLRNRLSSQFEICLQNSDLVALERAGIINCNMQPEDPREKSTLLKNLKIATVDNFQGNEAKVVIISLVRSNHQKNCGFLKTPNRINVLLSRAKHGMYIIGNSRTSAAVPMWSNVIDMLKEGGNIGYKLPICCPRHKTQVDIQNPDDFQAYAPEGGCQMPCERPLEPCGHPCTQKCHSQLRHNNEKCLRPCERPKWNCAHVCEKPCGERCDTFCKELLKDVNFKLPCGHVIQDMECEDFDNRGAIKCKTIVEKVVAQCKHSVRVECHVDVNDDPYHCMAPCAGKRKCGHTCTTPCRKCEQDSWFFEDDQKHGECPVCKV